MLGAAVTFVLYRGLIAIPVARMFSVTSWLIALVAAGMAGQAAAMLAGVDLIPSWGYQLWDTSWLLPQNSIIGARCTRWSAIPTVRWACSSPTFLVVLVGLLAGARLITNRSSDHLARSPN